MLYILHQTKLPLEFIDKNFSWHKIGNYQMVSDVSLLVNHNALFYTGSIEFLYEFFSSCHTQNRVSYLSSSEILTSLHGRESMVFSHCSWMVENSDLCSLDLKFFPIISFIASPAVEAASTTCLGIPAIRATCKP